MAEHITILHLSDLHFAGTAKPDAKIVIDALIKDIERECAESKRKIDLVIFSGDLVNAGGIKALFDEVKPAFIDRVIAAAKLTENEFVVCPGNHDIDREVVTGESYIETGLLHELKTRAAINSFLDKHSQINVPVKATAPIQRLAHFYEKIWTFKQQTSVAFSQFMLATEFLIASKRVGVCCFNSAWRTTGQSDDIDYGNLIIGERIVDDGVKAVSDCDIRIAVFHHPLSWLQDTDQAAVEGRLQTEFDLLVFGHVHRSSPEQRRTLFGEVIVSQGSCLYHSRDWFNGYNIIRIAPDAGTLEIAIQEYSDTRREFIPATRVLSDPLLKFRLPPRGNRSSLGELLIRAKVGTRLLANNHISLVGESGEQLNIEKHFECPELVRGSISFSPAPLQGEPKEQVEVLLRSEKSIVIVGGPESGKTTFAHYLAVQVSNGAADCGRLPLIGRFTDLQKGDHALWRLLRNYANEISDNSITRATLENEKVLAIIDDLDLFDMHRLEILTSLIAAHANVRWILLVKNPAGSVSLQPIIDKHFLNVEVVTIQGLTRSAVRALSTSRMQLENDESGADALYRSVMEQIQRTGLPRSGYIVSLILWAIKNKSSGELLNEAVLLQNIIDFMLGRMDYTGALRSELDFTTKSSILQHMALHFKETKDVQDKNDVLQFIINLLKRKGLKYDAGALLNSFVGCGVLYELGAEISFRYKRFQEFFVAGYLRDNPIELEKVKEEKYFDFARELDLFTARWRHESSFLEIGKKHLQSIPVSEPKLNGQLA
jgi:predicted MPP superfamily phosphohydrolase